VAYGIQPGIEVALQLRDVVDVEDVLAVTLHVAPFTWWECGSEPEKWDPRTRETADHSLPYAFARAFQHGVVDVESFEEHAFRDAKTLSFMKKISVLSEPDFGAQVPSVTGVRAEVVSTDGTSHVKTVRHARGHHANPMTKQEISDKARQLIEPVLGAATDTALETAWQVRSVESFDSVLDAFTAH
jgi:2-methylcitrate dehydratase